MPIPISPPPTPAAFPGLVQNDCGSPFWLRINGVWKQITGVARTPSITPTRESSEIVSIDGYRYVQQAPRANREWDINWNFASPETQALVKVAAEGTDEIWLFEDFCKNMLPARFCFGATDIVVNCGGIPLRGFTAGQTVKCRIRNAMTTVLACWSDADAGTPVATIAYTGGTATVHATGDTSNTRASIGFASAADEYATITILDEKTSGLMVYESTAVVDSRFVSGAGLPCRVSVGDPDAQMLGIVAGQWRHTSSAAIKEIGSDDS